ncbi:MAG TPA: hypothetical protein VFC21_02345 [Bryobacteraceae bacterium]|nr:hypothetical protein [Bryobacteraceae bacterium]
MAVRPAGAPGATGATASANVPASISKPALSLIPELGGDYIPCKFTNAELQNLHDPQLVLTLTQADAENLKQSVSREVMNAAGNTQISQDLADLIIQNIAGADFTGLTPSQALGRIIRITGESKSQVAASPVNALVNKLNALKNPDPTSIKNFTDEGLQLMGSQDKAAVGDLVKTVTDLSNPTADDIRQATDKFLKDNANASKAHVNSLVDSARQALAVLARPADVGCAMSILSYGETSRAYGFIIARNYIAVQVVVRNLNQTQEFTLHDVEYAVNTDPSGTAGRFFSGRDKVIVRALSAAQQTFDPRNITVQSMEGVGALFSSAATIFGGAMVNVSGVFNGAVLPSLEKGWKDESKDQLNLLNDTGFSSAASSQWVVPKASTVTLVTFVPAKQFSEGWWTQPCVRNIYLGTQNSRGRVVPKKLRYYTPDEDDQEVNRALQACASIAPPQPVGHWYRRSKEPASFLHLPVSSEEAIVHVDTPAQIDGQTYTTITLAKGLEYSWDADLANIRGTFGGKPFQTTYSAVIDDPLHIRLAGLFPGEYTPGSGTLTLLGNDIFRESQRVDFKDWSGQSLQLFSNLSLVVVAGMHTIDQKDLDLSISQLSCPADSTGNVTFPSSLPANISCTLTGKNLNRTGKLILRNTQDATDSAIVSGTVSVTGDSTNATVVFPAEDLRCLAQPSYSVYSVAPNGAEQPTSQALHFAPGPYVSKVDPPAIRFTNSLKTQNVTATGCGLASVTGIQLVSGSGQTAMAALSTPAPTNASVTVTVNSADLKTFAASEPKVGLAVVVKSTSVPINPTLSIDGGGTP